MTPDRAERTRELAATGRLLAPLLEPAVLAWFDAGENGHISLILSAPDDDTRREATANLRAMRALRGAIGRAVADGERARRDIETQSEIQA